MNIDTTPAGEIVSRRVRLTPASEIPIEPVVWAWADADGGRIPAGSLTMAAGREGTGKSTFGSWLAARVTTGTLPGALFGTPVPVFYIAVEDSWRHTLAPRLTAAGADLSMVYRFEVVSETDDELTLSLPADNRLLEDAILEYGAGLVIIDPLMSVIGARVDTHRERDVRTALDPLARMADRTGAVLLGIAHFNKSSGTDAASLITGSGAFKNVPRSVFGFARDDDERVMSQVKNSLGRDDLPSLSYRIETAELDTPHGVAEVGRFEFTGTSDRSVADIIRDSHGDDEERTDRDDAAAWLADYLAEDDGAAPAAEILKSGRAAGFSDSTLKRAKKQAGITSRRDGFGRGSKVIWVHTGHIEAIGVKDKDVDSMAPMADPMGEHTDSEEFTKGPKNSRSETLNSSNSSRPDTDCTICGFPLDPVLIDEGDTTHPACEATPDQWREHGANAVADRLVHDRGLDTDDALRLAQESYRRLQKFQDPNSMFLRIAYRLDNSEATA